jgi:hypothetical protein
MQSVVLHIVSTTLLLNAKDELDSARLCLQIPLMLIQAEREGAMSEV